jgi:hypothetical protein
METTIHSVVAALMNLEAKGCHHVCFEYVNGLFRVHIYKCEGNRENTVYEGTINPVQEQARMKALSLVIETLSRHIVTTVFQCHKRVFVKGEGAGEWVKTKPVIEFGDHATFVMRLDNSGYYINDPDNDLQYFVDMTHISEKNS